MLAGQTLQFSQRLFDALGLLVATPRNHGVEGIGYGDQAGSEVDVLSGDTVGVALTSPSQFS